MFMIALTMGMIGCSSEQKKDEISVENDSPKETVQEEVADVKTVNAKLQKQKQKLQNRQSQRLQKKPKKPLRKPKKFRSKKSRSKKSQRAIP